MLPNNKEGSLRRLNSLNKLQGINEDQKKADVVERAEEPCAGGREFYIPQKPNLRQQVVWSSQGSPSGCTDDTHLYLSFKPDSDDNQTEAVDAVQEYIEDIRAWMAADQLKLNEDKPRSF